MTLEAKREVAFRRLRQREEERKKAVEERKKLTQAKADPRENPTVFWEELNETLQSAEELVRKFVDAHTVKLKRTKAKKEITAISGAQVNIDRSQRRNAWCGCP